MNVDSIFEKLLGAQVDPVDKTVLPVVYLTTGVSATAYLRTQGRGSGKPRLAVSALSDVYEGTGTFSREAMWSGDDVLGQRLGVRARGSSLTEGAVLWISDGSSNFATILNELMTVSSLGDSWFTIEGVEAELFNDGQIAQVYTLGQNAGMSQSVSAINIVHKQMVLNGMYHGIRRGDSLIFEFKDHVQVGYVEAVTTAPISILGVDVPHTRLELDDVELLATAFLDPPKIWYDARKVGTLEYIPTKTVTLSDILNKDRPVTLEANTEALPAEHTPMIIEDAEGTALYAEGGGHLGDDDQPYIRVSKIHDEEFSGELVKPITFSWGLTTVTRGETVEREILGSGDASQAWQRFELAKSPLTYVNDPLAPTGRRPELTVYVNGQKWRRAPSFYKAEASDEIYVVEHDEDHNTRIVFGDGELGKRVPTGRNNVVATYRFGVGGNVAAGEINRLVKPVKGVRSVTNPLPASGGEEPPTPAQAREQAIQSTRVLGHLVSLPDFEVEAARYGGVLQARAEWAWDALGEDAVAKLWIVAPGAGDPSEELQRYLQKRAEPATRIRVQKATRALAQLILDLEFDPDFIADEVQAAVDARLFDEFDGLLAPRNAPIGRPLFRSELYAALHEVPGVATVQGVSINGQPMGAARAVAEGSYLALTYDPIF